MHQKLKTPFIACAAILALLVSSVSLAQAKYAIAGIGSTSCGQYLKPPSATKEVSEVVTVTWVQGYLSGTNTQRAIDTKAKMKPQPDAESIVAFIDQFCRTNPLKSVYEAAMVLDFSS